MFAKSFGYVNPIPILDEVDTFDHLVLPTGVILIWIGTGVGTQTSLDFQLQFRLHDLRSEWK